MDCSHNDRNPKKIRIKLDRTKNGVAMKNLKATKDKQK